MCLLLSAGKPAAPQSLGMELVGDMPSFEGALSEKQIEHLLTYLNTL